MPGPTPRQLAREETLRRIKALALGQLAEGGAGDLSLRAIARELNLVSSAIYRYFGSRDELITALIIDAFNDLAEVLERSGGRDRRTPVRRWQDVCFAFRDWAREQPHRFGLIYGSSIPGYHAPRETVEPAVRGYRAFCLAGVDADPPFSDVGGRELRGQLATALEGLELAVSEQAMLALAGAFARIIGLITLELGGHFVGSFEPADKLFEALVHREAEILGITGQRRRTQRAESMP
jgi:AcrR family transcriptional regulator